MARLLGPYGNSSQIPFDSDSSMLARVRQICPTFDSVVPLLFPSSSKLWVVRGFLGSSHTQPLFQHFLVPHEGVTCAFSRFLGSRVHRTQPLRSTQPLNCFLVLRLVAKACILLRLPLFFVCAVGLVHCTSTLSFFRVTKNRTVVILEVVCWEISSLWISPSSGHSRFCFRTSLVSLSFAFVLLVRLGNNTVMEVVVMVKDSSAEVGQGFWSWRSELDHLLPSFGKVEVLV